MKLIFSIFSSSPLQKIELHMKQVSACIHVLQKMVPLMLDRKYEELDVLLNKISQLKQIGELAKQRIEKSLSSSIFIPVKRRALLKCLKTQNKISIHCHRIARLFSAAPPQKHKKLEDSFEDFFSKIILPFQRVLEVVFEFKELQVSSFGGSEAAKVSFMVETIVIIVKEAEIELKHILKTAYQSEDGQYNTAAYWSQLLLELETIALLSEKLAHLIKMMLEM